MTVHWSDAVRNAVVDAWETAIGTAPKVRIYGGTVPADEAAALGAATLLAEFTLASDWASNAAAGTKSLSGLPVSVTGEAGAGAGTNATFYRIYASDGVTCHEQGSVGTSGADMTIDSATISSGQTVRITAWSKTAPH